MRPSRNVSLCCCTEGHVPSTEAAKVTVLRTPLHDSVEDGTLSETDE